MPLIVLPNRDTSLMRIKDHTEPTHTGRLLLTCHLMGLAVKCDLTAVQRPTDISSCEISGAASGSVMRANKHANYSVDNEYAIKRWTWEAENALPLMVVNPSVDSSLAISRNDRALPVFGDLRASRLASCTSLGF